MVMSGSFNSKGSKDYVATALENSSSRKSTGALVRSGLVALNIAIRIYSALYMIISDCDETFNYWEPLNLLLRGFGKQTWEYSPEYAIRAYTYLIPYYLVAYPVRFIAENIHNLQHGYGYYQFYLLRMVALCGLTSYSELSLTNSIDKHLSSQVANWYLLFSSVAPGMAHAGVALLPSSFAMQCNTLALSYVISAVSTKQVSTSVGAITWFLIGGIIGWPFALALGLTFGLYTLLNPNTWKPARLLKLLGGCATALAIIVGVITLIDSYFYSKLLLVPLNIVFYNVFGGEGEGPEIFGVEPFSYYIMNLLVNFNVIAVLGYVGAIVSPLTSRKLFSTSFNLSAPLAIWSLIFFSQPHKEERFLYPIYPLISINAAIFTTKVFTLFNQVASKLVRNGRLVRALKFSVQCVFTASVVVVSLLRIVNLVENYSAPIRTFELISTLPPSVSPTNVCIGKEWYHFPNSFFLPDNFRLKFVKSGFDGLLPGDFKEHVTSLIEATSSIPPNMNNKNLFEADKVVDFGQCDYYIDNTEASNSEEPRLVQNIKGSIEVVDPEWHLLGCNKIIDPNGVHSGIGRLIYIPRALRKFIPYKVQYLQFCALKKSESIV